MLYELKPMPDAPRNSDDPNDKVPDGLCEITLEEFSHSNLFTYSPERYEWRQMLGNAPNNFTGKTLALQMFWHDEHGGVAMARNSYRDEHGPVRFFRFGCTHKHTTELSQSECRLGGIYHGGNCYHVVRCNSCGKVIAHDTSD